MTGNGDRDTPRDRASDDALFAARMLDRLAVPPPSAALLGRVLAGRPQVRLGWRELFGLVPASAFVAAVAIGLWIGGQGLVPPAFAAGDDTDWISQAVGVDVFDDGSNG